MCSNIVYKEFIYEDKTLFSLTLIIMLMLNTLISSGAELVIEPVSEPELTHMPQYIEPVNIQGRYKLTELGSNLTLWTDYVSEKVFKELINTN